MCCELLFLLCCVLLVFLCLLFVELGPGGAAFAARAAPRAEAAGAHRAVVSDPSHLRSRRTDCDIFDLEVVHVSAMRS